MQRMDKIIWQDVTHIYKAIYGKYLRQCPECRHTCYNRFNAEGNTRGACGAS